MNAQTPAWHRYTAAVDGLVPGQNDEARQLRARIMAMRDRAGQILQKHEVDWAANHLLTTVQSLGCAYATASIDVAELKVLRAAMADLFNIAASLQVIGRTP